MVIEDDAAVARVVTLALTARGYDVQSAPTGGQAFELCRAALPDVIVLDLGLPDVDGIEWCRQFRRWAASPIIVLTADGSEDRMIAALDQGADDYVTKPFSVPQLDARVRVALRHRRQQGDHIEGELLSLGSLIVDVGGQTASVAGVQLQLTRREFALLAVMAQNPGKVLTAGFLLERAWGPGFADNLATLRNRVVSLRKQLALDADAPQILTEAGMGYRLSLPKAPEACVDDR